MSRRGPWFRNFSTQTKPWFQTEPPVEKKAGRGWRLSRYANESSGSVERMSRTKTPLLASLLLSFFGGWIASCSDEVDPACAPGDTRLCAGIGRCQGAQACLPDGSGYGECDCSGPPREDNGEQKVDPGVTTYVGRACTEDAQCGEGLTCFTAGENDFLGGGAPGGYCTIPCAEDAECTALDRQSACVVTGEGSAGLCMRTCLSLDPRSLAENKCLGRRDLVCKSEAYLGFANFTGLRQRGWCFPQCGSDEDCDGRFCNLATGLCQDAAPPGLPIGARCNANNQCAGGSCIGLGSSGEAFCSAPCVLGQPVGCGFGVSANPRGAGCLLPRVQGLLGGTEGLGDVGICVELCSEDAECEQFETGGWICDESPAVEDLLNRPGVCDPPLPSDAGADAAPPADAGGLDASSVSDGG